MSPRLGVGVGVNTIQFFSGGLLQAKVKFDLLENGLDFIYDAVTEINSIEDHKKLKYSIIHLAAGLELLFKEVLKNEHWTLIFEKTNDAKLDSLASGEFISVNFKSALDRLHNICGINIPKETLELLNDIRKKRNRIEHFDMDENVDAIKNICSKVLSFILSFIDKNIDDNKITQSSKTILDKLPAELGKFKSFVTEREKEIKDIFESKKQSNLTLIKCPKCMHKYLFIEDDMKCLFCHYSDTKEDILNELVKTFHDSQSDYVESCFDCHSKMMLEIDDHFVCLDCGKSWITKEIDACDLCGKLVLKEKIIENDGVCDSCLSP